MTRPCLIVLLSLFFSGVKAQDDFFVPMEANPNVEVATDAGGEVLALDGNRLIVGSPNYDGGGMARGKVQVYAWDGQAWQPLGAPFLGTQDHAQLGTAVAISGLRIAIGAPYHRGAQMGAGRVLVYEWDGQTWQSLGVPFEGEQGRERLGAAVALDGQRLLIGSPKYDGAATNSGRVQAFEWEGQTWQPLGKALEGEEAGEEWGSVLDLDGDHLAVAAPFYAYNSPRAGRVQVCEWKGTNWQPLGQPLRGTAPQVRFGFALDLEGDRLAIGTPDPSANNSGGQVVVYQWNASNWGLVGQPIQGVGMGDEAGWALDLQGNRLAVGAPSNDAKGNLAGQVQLYEWNGMVWQGTGPALQGDMGQTLGYGVALSANRLIIAAPGYTAEGQRGTILAYTFCQQKPDIAVHTQTNTLIASSSQALHYQWRHCDAHQTPIVGAIFDNYTPPTNGRYTLSVRQGGCTHLLDCYTIDQVKPLAQLTQQEAKVFPNPTVGPFTVVLDRWYERVVLRLYNLGGKILHEQRYDGGEELSCSIEFLPAGVYLLMVQAEDQSPVWLKVHKD